MPRNALTGSRIRARRVDLGLRQAQLAEACGISASYLNLIEHNRRRIGGKLLVNLARELDVEVAALSEGADLALLDDLRAAASGLARANPERDRAEEFAGRFPGWAKLIVEQGRRIAALEQAVETLSDRLAHDPFLSASLHDILSTVTAVRSTSAILAEEDDIDPAWQARFHRNLHEDSLRLADASRALVAYLDAGGDATTGALSPQEELEAWLERCDFRVPSIEAGEAVDDETLIADAPELGSASARALAAAYLAQYRADVAAIPQAAFRAAVAAHGPDPSALAGIFGTGFPAVFRRLAALGDDTGLHPLGLAICDGSGTLVFRKQIEGFPMPRFGSACPLWPLFHALSRPMTAVRQVIELAGRDQRRFLSYAIAETAYPDGFDGPAVTRSHMLLVPVEGEVGARRVVAGTSCRICPREDCAARREISILGTARQDGETTEAARARA